MSLIMGIVGIVQDQRKWLAITVVVITSLLFLVWIVRPILFILCS